MLFLLIVLLLIAAGFTMMTKRNRESLFLMGMCCSLMVQFTGILIFIAKKGGYSKNIISFLFFSQTLRIKLQYLFITLDTLGYIIAIGRYLFPLFLLESALQYSMIGWLRRHPDVQKWICLLPAVTLAVYFLACLVVFSLGLGILLSAAMVFFRDTQFLWGVVSMLWMYATPIFYPESIIPERFMLIYKMNPLYHIIRFIRTILINGVSPEPKAYVLALIASVVPLIIGITVFKRTQDRFVLNI